MKKISYLFLFVLTYINAPAQISAIFQNTISDSTKVRIGVQGDYNLNATSLTNSFMTKFYTGGFIDSDLKNTVLDRTKENNRIGAEINYGIYGAFKMDSLFHKNYFNLFFSIRNRAHFDAQFSRDLYTVGFYGNSQYTGRTANFNNFDLNLYRYQQFQIGLFSAKPEAVARWGIALSFLTGQQYATVKAKTAELYTDVNVNYVNFNTSIEIAQSDINNKRYNAFNGYGTSLDLFIETAIKKNDGKSKLKIEISDFGFIKFNDQSLYLQQDSLFHFDGFYVQNIYDLKDSIFANASQAGIKNSLFPLENESYTVIIPANLNINFETKFNAHFHLTEGIRYIFNANYSLLSYIMANIYFTKNFMLSTSIGYGGYSNFNYGLGLSANLGSSFIINAGSHNIEGYLIPTKTTGQGAYFSLIKTFN